MLERVDQTLLRPMIQWFHHPVAILARIDLAGGLGLTIDYDLKMAKDHAVVKAFKSPSTLLHSAFWRHHSLGKRINLSIRY